MVLHRAVVAWYDGCVELSKVRGKCRRELRRQFNKMCRDTLEPEGDCKDAFSNYCDLPGSYKPACGQ